mmetsp:Transcript_103082/g.183161  ORF Transcript_103082/g.183161 Transcript_103082/m.183161 type:complete len:96 (-) Transcript_103082:90-377(-)
MSVTATAAWRKLLVREGSSRASMLHRPMANLAALFGRQKEQIWDTAYADSSPSSLTYVPITQAGRLMFAVETASRPRLAYERRLKWQEEDFETFV